jgi:hypothetical protein
MTDERTALQRWCNASKLTVSTMLYLEFEQRCVDDLLREYQRLTPTDHPGAVNKRAMDVRERIVLAFTGLVSAGDAQEIEEIRYRLHRLHQSFAQMNIRLNGLESVLAHVAQHGPPAPPPTK